MKKLMVGITVLVMVIAALWGALSPCGFAQTVSGMRRAVLGETGTYLYQGNGLLLMGWYQGGRYYFVDVAMGAVQGIKAEASLVGQSTTWQEAGQFLSWLEANGFKRVFPGDVDPRVVNALADYSLLSLAGLAVRAMPSIIVMPAGVIQGLPAGVSQ
jgi:hypothetical protein